ncbi:MAG: hypothetical protein HY820_34200 [Acidobacteria bacterium]|nr:hypothetical protein [Acidobacteriota bacterium]
MRACTLLSAAILSTALLGAATLQSPAPLRSGCDSDEPVLAQLPSGIPVEIRSSISGSSGSCFKIVATHDGKSVSGYVPKSAVSDAGSFDQARRGARGIGSSGSSTNTSSSMSQVEQTEVQSSLVLTKLHPASKAIELLNANQPAEALRIVESALQKVPADPALHTVAGLAYYRMDDMDRAIIHWREAENIAPSAAVQNMLRKAEREKKADSGSERTTGIRVLLRYERGTVPAGLAQNIIQALDEEFSRISSQLGCRAVERITAVALSRQAYFQSTQAAEWSGALYDGRIHIPITDSKTVTPQMRKTFAHELTHACLHELGNWPSWLHEGLAQKFSGEGLQPGRKAQLDAAIKAGKVPKLGRLGQNWSGLSSENAAMAYTLALVAAEKLSDLYANTGLGNILRDPSGFGEVETKVAQALGL